MRKLLRIERNTFLLIFLWLIGLFFTQIIARFIIPYNKVFQGPIPWANFDGVHYLSIAEGGYHIYQQAFFPIFPLVIHVLSRILPLGTLIAGLVIVYSSFFMMTYRFDRLVELDYNHSQTFWSRIFLLSFPTSFFFVSLYTEGFFLALIFTSFYFARKEKFLLASLLGFFASATRLIGIFLFPALLFELLKSSKRKSLKAFASLLFVPLGLASYMVYLGFAYKDPLLFIHTQPAFGAGRSGSSLVFFPQVIWRYAKIMLTFSFSNMTYWIAFLEISVFICVLLVLYLSMRKKIRTSYIIFSFLSIVLPSFSGTLSSVPRYALSSFVIFIFFATIKNKFVKTGVLIIGLILEIILCSLFLQGYFVS